MQNWILDFDFYKSASYLDRNRLQANIYENIHGLASLLNINDKLVNPKRSVINHPNIKRWIGFEKIYLKYVHVHLEEWIKRGYRTNINLKNLEKIACYISYNFKDTHPKWINQDLINKHRQILLEKNYEYYSRFFI